MNLTIFALVFAAPGACERYSLVFEDGEDGIKFTGEGHIFKLSRLLQGCTRYGGKTEEGAEIEARFVPGREIHLPFPQRTFDTLRWMLGDEVENIPKIDTCPLHLFASAWEYLALPKEGLDVTPLRRYVEMCGLCVCVKGDTATLCLERDAEYEGGEEADGVKEVRILPDAFEKLVRKEPGSGKEGVNRWDVLAWILAHMEIEALNLMYCYVGNNHVAPIGKLVKLRKLAMWYCGPEGVDLTPLSPLESMQELDIRGLVLDARAIRAISKLVNLRKLGMRRCCLEEFDFGPLSALEELDMSFSMLDERALGAISGLVKLRKLVMRNCSLGGVDLTPLGTLDHLEEFDVSLSTLDERAFGAISGLVKLKRLVMHKCGGLNVFDFTPLGALQELDISDNWLDERVFESISGLVKLRKLVMYKCHGFYNLEPLSFLKRLRALDVSSRGLNDGAVRVISGLVELRRLIMRGCQGPAGLVTLLSSLERLEALDVSYLTLNAEDIQTISGFVELRRLVMEGHNLNEFDFTLLGGLEELDVSLSTLDARAILTISGLVNLKKLMIMKCRLVGQINLAPLGDLVHLKEVHIWETELSEKDLSEILPRTQILTGLQRWRMTGSHPPSI